MIATLSGVVLGCSSKVSKKELSSSRFTTRISESGLKHFELRYSLMRTHDETRDNANPPSKTRNVSRGAIKKAIKNLNKIADAKIEENGYCSRGYWILQTDIGPRGPFLRGECNDLATDEDRRNFPDTIKNW